MRPLKKSDWPEENGERKIFSPYGKAKNDLVANLGSFCSFCEERGYYSALDVEHVQPKKYQENGQYIFAHLEEDWENFLLGCKNCNPIKSDKKVLFTTHAMPHKEDTHSLFEYRTGGAIKVKEGLSSAKKQRAEATISLVGLDRKPGHSNYSDKDMRWLRRFEVWTLATKYLQRYSDGITNIDDLLEIAHGKGFWSVWMSVFASHQEVRQGLIEKFEGTNTSYFDS